MMNNYELMNRIYEEEGTYEASEKEAMNFAELEASRIIREFDNQEDSLTEYWDYVDYIRTR